MENSPLVRDARMEEEAIDEMENMTEEKGSQLHPHPQRGRHKANQGVQTAAIKSRSTKSCGGNRLLTET